MTVWRVEILYPDLVFMRFKTALACIEGVHDLEPGQIRVRSFNRWSRFDELIVLCGSTREQVGCRFLDVFRGVEGTVVPAKHEFISPNA